MRFSLERHGADGLERARHGFEHRVESPWGCRETFEYLVEIAHDAEWFPDFIEGGWEGSPPHGVGSVRWFRSELLWLREEFVIWAPGERFAFIGTQTTLPLMRRFAEDYRFTPHGNGCVVTWRILYTPRCIFVPLHPFLRPVFDRMFRDAAAAMAAALRGAPALAVSTNPR